MNFLAHLYLSPPNDEIIIGIRPENIKIEDTGRYKAKVVDSVYLGDHYVVTVDYKGYKLVISGEKNPVEFDKTVNFVFDPDKVLFFDKKSGTH